VVRVAELAGSLADQAEANLGAVMPGYTHLQRAQPVSLSHHLLAHTFPLIRDADRLRRARRAASRSALGAGALAGSTLAMSPDGTAGRLGLAGVFENSIDAVSDRDFLADGAYACSMGLVHLSRLAEEIVLWTSAEFGFAALEDRLATGSSIMPQKKNADAAELVRARTGRAVAAVTSVLVTLKALPLAYDRDLQEDRAPLYDAVDLAREAARMLALLVRGLRFDRGALRRACERGYLTATELADHLVRAGVPFRDAHAVVGRIVRELAERDRGLDSLTLDELRRYDARFGPSALEELKVERAVASRASPGGTAPARVREALEAAEARRRARSGER
jgi:argininosuccinate lyase